MRAPVLSPRQFDWLLIAFGATLAPHLLWLPPLYGLMLGTILVLRYVQRRRYVRAWPGWIKFPLLIAVIAFVIAEFGNPLARQAGSAALIGLTVLKLIESENRSDGLRALLVCLFLNSVQFLFDQSLLVTVYMLLPTFLVFIAMNELVAPPGTRGGIAGEFARIGRELVPLLLITLPLTAFLFVSVPRLETPLWGTRDNQWEARTGLGDEMRPGSITELLADDSPVMRVTFDGPAPPTQQMYWRGPVLVNFDGEVWRRRAWPGATHVGEIKGPQSGGPDDLRYEVMLEPTDRNWVFALDVATGFPEGVKQQVEGHLLRTGRVTSVWVYRAASNLRAGLPQGPAPSVYRSETLRLPSSLNPQALALAQGWVAQGGDRAQIVAQALQYFRNGGFSYTLTPTPLVGRHRVDEFLFETRDGFCEHYSQAFVVLMRAAGIPARVVTGYMGGERSSSGAYYIVRNADAHAWAEVLLSDDGTWTRIDPTAAVAPDRISLGSGTFGDDSYFRNNLWWKAIRLQTDALQHWFNSMVVRFDTLRQREFFANLGIDPSDWRQLGAWMAGGIAALALAMSLWMFGRRPTSGDLAQRRYRRFQKRLQQLGVGSNPAEGPMDFAERAALQLPHLRAAIFAVSHAYARLRYADDSEAVAQLNTALLDFLKSAKP